MIWIDSNRVRHLGPPPAHARTAVGASSKAAAVAAAARAGAAATAAVKAALATTGASNGHEMRVQGQRHNAGLRHRWQPQQQRGMAARFA